MKKSMLIYMLTIVMGIYEVIIFTRIYIIYKKVSK